MGVCSMCHSGVVVASVFFWSHWALLQWCHFGCCSLGECIALSSMAHFMLRLCAPCFCSCHLLWFGKGTRKKVQLYRQKHSYYYCFRRHHDIQHITIALVYVTNEANAHSYIWANLQTQAILCNSS